MTTHVHCWSSVGPLLICIGCPEPNPNNTRGVPGAALGPVPLRQQKLFEGPSVVSAPADDPASEAFL